MGNTLNFNRVGFFRGIKVEGGMLKWRGVGPGFWFNFRRPDYETLDVPTKNMMPQFPFSTLTLRS